MEDSDIKAEDNGKITAENTVEYTGHAPDKPILKDVKTGKFIKGTGSSGKGGRKPGSKDRVSQQLLDIAQSLMERRGAELLEEVADRAPEQALALITKIIPASELQKLFEEERSGQKSGQPVQINIGVVKGPERLSDGRSQQDIDDRQRGLTQRIERASEPVERVVSDVPQEVAQTTSQPQTQRPRVGGSPGYKRGQSNDSTVYLDDPVDDEGDTLRDLYQRDEYL